MEFPSVQEFLKYYRLDTYILGFDAKTLISYELSVSGDAEYYTEAGIPTRFGRGFDREYSSRFVDEKLSPARISYKSCSYLRPGGYLSETHECVAHKNKLMPSFNVQYWHDLTILTSPYLTGRHVEVSSELVDPCNAALFPLRSIVTEFDLQGNTDRILPGYFSFSTVLDPYFQVVLD